jgi:hypothetical protein
LATEVFVKKLAVRISKAIFSNTLDCRVPSEQTREYFFDHNIYFVVKRIGVDDVVYQPYFIGRAAYR